MKRTRLVYFIAFIALLPGLALAQKNAIPLFKGFPVYPPEKVKELNKDSEETDLLLPIRNRDAIRAELDKMRGEKLNEKIWKKSHDLSDKIEEEFKKAEDYIKANASELGWEITDEGIYRDGGSRYYLFTQKNKKIVKVTLWTYGGGGMVCTADGCDIYQENWGHIDYDYKQTT